MEPACDIDAFIALDLDIRRQQQEAPTKIKRAERRHFSFVGIVRSSRQEYGARVRAYLIRLRLIQKRLIARTKQVFWRLVIRVHCEVPPGAIRHGWYVKGDRFSAGIEHEV